MLLGHRHSQGPNDIGWRVRAAGKLVLGLLHRNITASNKMPHVKVLTRCKTNQDPFIHQDKNKRQFPKRRDVSSISFQQSICC